MTKILLVEDDKSLREIYGVRLLAEGYDIVSAGDGEEALSQAMKERPDLIISDVMMPKISGFEMLDLLRANPSTKDIKVIMMTALSSEQQRQRGEALGANRYLVKSQVGIEDVVRTVHEVLNDQASASAPPAAAPNQSPINPPAATQPSVEAARTQPAPIAPPPPREAAPTPAAPVVNQDAAPAMPTPMPTPMQPSTTPSPTTPPPAPVAPPAPTAPPQYQQAPAAVDPNTPFSPQPTDPNNVDLAQSGSSMKSHKIMPTGETLTPQVDLNALLEKEAANEIIASGAPEEPTPQPLVSAQPGVTAMDDPLVAAVAPPPPPPPPVEAPAQQFAEPAAANPFEIPPPPPAPINPAQ